MKLIAPEEALRLVLERAAPLAVEPVALDRALGRVLGADVSSAEDVPGFDNSAMDGFAVRSADTAPARPGCPVALAIVGESRAGRPSPVELTEGQAIRISTGAMVPAGADAIVRVEDTAEGDGSVEVGTAVPAGAEVRRAGEDIRARERVLERGTVLGPAELGVLASVGVGEVICTRRPRVAVLTTGDELVGPDRPLGPGELRNSNAHTVPAQAREAGAEVTAPVTVPDERQATVEAIAAGLDADVLVVCGGVSVGEHDHVKAALAELGAEEVFWGIAIRPGKPTWFGVRRDTLVFGLPGNPVSAMVIFHLLARPALAALLGRTLTRRVVTAIMDEDYPKRAGRAHAVRCRLEAREDGFHVRPTREQGSHVLTSMLGAQALALLEVEREMVRAGERVQVELLG